jgi:hypothetical protein
LQFNVAVAFSPPQIPEAKAVIVAGAAVIPTQLARPLALMLVFTGSDVLQVALFSVRLLSEGLVLQASVALPSVATLLVYWPKFPVAVNWTVSLVEPWVALPVAGLIASEFRASF